MRVGFEEIVLRRNAPGVGEVHVRPQLARGSGEVRFLAVPFGGNRQHVVADADDEDASPTFPVSASTIGIVTASARPTDATEAVSVTRASATSSVVVTDSPA